MYWPLGRPGRVSRQGREGDASVPTPRNPTPAFTGRYFAMSLRKPLRTRRGGGRVVRGRDACVALAGGGKRAQEQDEGDASVPSYSHQLKEGDDKGGLHLT